MAVGVDTISKCSPSIVWDTEDKAFYYQSQDDLFRADKLYKHVLGSDPKDDEMLHHNDDEKFFAFIGKSGSGRFLILGMSSPQTTEFHYLDLETPGATLKCFTPRQHGHRYSIDHRGDYFLILTDGGGPFLNGKVQKVGINDTSRELWQDVLPYNPYHETSDVSCFANFIVLQERVDGNNRIRVIESLDNPESSYLIPFDAEFFAAYMSQSSVQDFNSDSFRLTFHSPLTPTKTLEYNVKTKEFTLLKQQEVPSGFDASEYTLRRVHVPIPEELRVKAPHDTPVAEAVPVTLVYKTALFKSDNTNKVHLYGYGSYGIPMDPYFSPAFPSLIDRGIVYAIAHIRGGGDLGRGWYETGKFLNKKNTFYDFVNSAKYLVEQGITQHQLITLEGGSAGGLLIGASLNLKPDVAVAAIASVPFVDVINTMMDPTLPLTVAEYEEWGNPNEKEYFDYMLSYSPYDNIKANTKYPSILAKGGLFDPRVGYWEPAKWIAKLRASNTNGAEDDPHKSTFIFDCKMGSGHFGSSGRYARFKEKASEYAFIVTQLEASEKRLAAAARKWNKTTTTTTTTVTIGAFYYQSQDDLFRADKLYKHVLGSDPKDDEMLHHNDDEKFFAFIGKSGSERFLILRMSSPQTTEFHYLDLETPGATLKCFTPRQHGHRYSIDHRGDYFLILTDGGGPFLNGKVQKVGINDTSRELWQDVLPYNPYHEIRDVSCFADFIVLQERVDGNNRIRVIESLDNPESSYLIPFDAEFFAAYLSRSSVQDFNSDRFRLTFYSPLTPTKTLDYNVKTKEFTLLKQQKVPSGFDASEYTLRRVHVPIPEELRVKAPHDTPVAEAVPVTLVYKTALFKSDNTNKVHLYGYGSYGIPIDPYFSPAFPSLIDRGIVYAIAHIRGGGDLGRGWYETGKFLNKKNTFYDFVNSAKYLVEQGITQHQLITLEGGSAGGLLIGASLNLKPDVAVAAIASVPFVDVINTMMDPTLPLTVAEYEEWGNPNEKEYFDYMLSYSPYDNIKANTKYPSILAKGGLFDPRVGYWEPAKWIAKLRASNTNGAEDDPHKSTFFFDCKMGSGHFGSSGRYARFKEMASEYAFI
ncbi:hypothetical protein HDU79_011932, partial [Rhizoclosmatium sp. JEL0117]